MSQNGGRRWLGMAIGAALLYLAIGLVSIELAGAAASERMQFFWRLSGFAASGVVFVAHIVYEQVRLGHTARPTAWHVAVGVAFGGFALAVAANIHELASQPAYRPRMAFALLAWPLLTAVPAFIAALLVAAGIGMSRSRR